MTRRITNTALCGFLWAVLAGCVGPTITPGRVTNSAANVAEWDEAGNVRAVLQGGFPAQIETGPTGANIQASGQPRVLTFSITTDANGVTQRVATLADPSDTELSGFEMLPDGTIRLASFGALASAPLAVQNEAILAAFVAQGKMTDAQAVVWQRAIDAGQMTIIDVIKAALAGGV